MNLLGVNDSYKPVNSMGARTELFISESREPSTGPATWSGLGKCVELTQSIR